MALLELEKLRKDINTLFGYVRCLMDKPQLQNINYKSYVAVVTQFATNPPTVDNVLENTIGAITFSYSDSGEYLINSSGLFTSNKTVIMVSPGRPIAGGVELGSQVASTNSIILYSRNNLGLLTNSIIALVTIEIRVYN